MEESQKVFVLKEISSVSILGLLNIACSFSSVMILNHSGNVYIVYL